MNSKVALMAAGLIVCLYFLIENAPRCTIGLPGIYVGGMLVGGCPTMDRR